MPALLAIALAFGGQSSPVLVNGTVLDPGGLPVATAVVSLRCPAASRSTTTDTRGVFSVDAPLEGTDCRLDVTAAGFAPLEMSLADRKATPLVLRLRLRTHEERLTVLGDVDQPLSPRSAALEGPVLREFVTDVSGMLEYARALAGSNIDRTHVTVDGVRRNTLPLASRVDRVMVNADPFSAALAGLDGARLEIETAPLRRVWSYSAMVSPGAIAGRHPLGAGRQLQTRSVSGAIAGPLPARGFAWTAGASHTRREQEHPLLAPPPLDTSDTEVVSTGDRTTRAFAALTYDSQKTRVTADVAVDEARLSGVGAGGLTWPEAASDGRTRTVETHAGIRTNVGATTLRSSAAITVIGREAAARSTARGTSVSGGAVGGGAALSSDDSHAIWARWTARADGRARGRRWRAGVDLNTSRANGTWVPNINGAMVLSPARSDAVPVALLLDRGDGKATATTRSAAAYGELQWLHSTSATLSSGMRVDVATGDSPAFQPRASGAVRFTDGSVTFGVGRFAEEWAAETLLPLRARAAPTVQHVAFDGACAAMQDDPACEGLLGTASVSIGRQRQTIASIGINRSVRKVDLSSEYRWSATSGVPSLERALTDGGWLERFGSRGRQRQHEVRARVGVGRSVRTLVGHYAWRDARETTDGWYGSPVSGTGLALWAPAANVPRHEGGAVFSVRTRGGTSVSVVGSVAGGRPVDLVFSPQSLAEALTEPRRPGPRNAGAGPAFATVSVFASQRLGLPFTDARGRLGVQVVNLLGRRNLLAPVTVVDSPLYGTPTSAAPGRTLSFWFSLER